MTILTICSIKKGATTQVSQKASQVRSEAVSTLEVAIREVLLGMLGMITTKDLEPRQMILMTSLRGRWMLTLVQDKTSGLSPMETTIYSLYQSCQVAMKTL